MRVQSAENLQKAGKYERVLINKHDGKCSFFFIPELDKRQLARLDVDSCVQEGSQLMLHQH